MTSTGRHSPGGRERPPAKDAAADDDGGPGAPLRQTLDATPGRLISSEHTLARPLPWLLIMDPRREMKAVGAGRKPNPVSRA